MLEDRLRRYLLPLMWQLGINLIAFKYFVLFSTASLTGYLIVVLRPSLITWMIVRKDPLGRAINAMGVCLILDSIGMVFDSYHMPIGRLATMSLASAVIMSLFSKKDDDKKFERATDEKVNELVARVIAVHGPEAIPAPA